VSALINGGKKVNPYMLEAIYDHYSSRLFTRRQQEDSAAGSRMFTPSMGIRLRRNLLHLEEEQYDGVFVHAASAVRKRQQGSFNDFVLQNLLISAVPAKSPSLLLLMVSQRNELFPDTPQEDTERAGRLVRMEQLLPELLQVKEQRAVALQPPVPDRLQYKRFLISKRADLHPETGEKVVPTTSMPRLTGLSLRKGLQQIQKYDLAVRIEQGSGRISGQVPAAGASLQNVSECVLTLGPNI
jgi:cell division protein FtsI (penicillin-binding protein 3)